MRLNEKTYPAFHTLDKKNYEWLKIDEMFNKILTDVSKLNNFIKSIEEIHRQVDSKYYLTETFKDAIRLAIPKISKQENYIDKIPPSCGIMFTDYGFSLFLVNPQDKGMRFIAYGFTREVLTTYALVDMDNKYGGIAACLKDGKPYDDPVALSNYINSFLMTLYFIHNCEIETKVVKPKEKHRENGNKHLNESNSDIIFLDCKWFTELIRDAPFHVRGHLRWQNYGEKFSKRKLIWIEEFEKSGYKRKATKNIYEEQDN